MLLIEAQRHPIDVTDLAESVHCAMCKRSQAEFFSL